jgi:hypothetical protein
MLSYLLIYLSTYLLIYLSTYLLSLIIVNKSGNVLNRLALATILKPYQKIEIPSSIVMQI